MIVYSVRRSRLESVMKRNKTKKAALWTRLALARKPPTGRTESERLVLVLPTTGYLLVLFRDQRPQTMSVVPI